MRFIVELYRLLILAILALAIISASFIIFKVAQNPDLTSGASAYVMVAVFTAAIFVILSIGITATFISMHDRLESIAKSVAAITESAEVIATHQSRVTAAHPARETIDAGRQESR